MCRIKKARSPLGRNCGMYRKNMMSCCGWRESVPCPCHGHVIPFPGDSISFRLPRQPAGTSRWKALQDSSAGWPVLSLNNRKHPAKCSRPGCFYQMCMTFFIFLGCSLPAQRCCILSAVYKNSGRTAIHIYREPQYARQNVCIALFSVFKCIRGIQTPTSTAASPGCQGCAAHT